MKKAENSFFLLIVSLVAACFIGLTAIACGKPVQKNTNQVNSITVINSTNYDLTDIHLIYNNSTSNATDSFTVNAGDSISVEQPDASVYTVQISGKAANGQTFSGSFSGMITNDSFISVSIDENGSLSSTSNITE